MTKDDIIRMVQKADDAVCFEEDEQAFYEHFANLVADAEREACAQICDVLAVHPEYASEVTKLAAMAIRARSQS